MRYNNLMLGRLAVTRLEMGLADGLKRILNKGFCEIKGYWLLKAFVPRKTKVEKGILFDDIGVEHFYNEIHIDEIARRYDLKLIKPADRLSQAVIFASRLLRAWNEINQDKILVVNISENLDNEEVIVKNGVVFSCYVRRPKQGEWLGEDLEGFETEAVMEADSEADSDLLQSIGQCLTRAGFG